MCRAMTKRACVLGLLVLVGCGSSASVGDPSAAGGAGSTAGDPSTGGGNVSAPSKPAGGGSQAPHQDQVQPTDLGAPYPIVLVHGMAGFDQLTVGPLTVDYW